MGDSEELKGLLEAKLRDELNVIARRIGVSGYRKLTKAQLVSAILSLDHALVVRYLNIEDSVEASQQADDHIENLARTSQQADDHIENLAETSQQADGHIESLAETSKQADDHIENLAETSQQTDSDYALIRFFANHPAVGALGSIASVVGLFLAVYFFAIGYVSRELVYFVHPTKAVVVQAGQTSRLDISLDGSLVSQDVTAAQVAIWNEGRQSIRSENMLNPLVIRTGMQNPILEARVRKMSRDIIDLNVETDEAENGELRVNWKILEQHDGGILQIIFFGDTDTEITAAAIVEGQGDIRKLKYKELVRTGYEQYWDLSKWLGVIYLIVGILGGLINFLIFRYRRAILSLRRGDSFEIADKIAADEIADIPDGIMNFALIAGPLLILGISFYLLLLDFKPGPPFGF